MSNEEQPVYRRGAIPRSEVTPGAAPSAAPTTPAQNEYKAAEATRNMMSMGQSPMTIENAPPEFMARLKQAQESMEELEVAHKAVATPKRQNNLRIAGSAALEDLIEKSRQKTSQHHKVLLPSLGKFYDGSDGPADGVLHLRPMTGQEEQILATPSFTKKGVAMNMILDSCIQENIRSENLLSIDRNYLIIYLRGISYNDLYEVEIKCPFTDKKFPYAIPLDLDVDYCPDDFGPDSLVGVLPQTGFNFSYRLPIGSDEKKIQEHIGRKTNFDSQNKSNDVLLFRTALLLNEIEGLDNKEELQILLKNLPIGDLSHLRNIIIDPPFGVNTDITVVSPYTDEEFIVPLPIEQDFFFPRQRKAEKNLH